MTPVKKIKRVSIKPKKCPNPLFVKWIKEWIDEAVSRDSNVRFGYRKALKSIKSYPLVLRSGKDCGVLQDFGPKLCARLDRKLAEHRNGIPQEDSTKQQPKVLAKAGINNLNTDKPDSPKIKRTKKVVQPNTRPLTVPSSVTATRDPFPCDPPNSFYNGHSMSPPPSPPRCKKTKTVSHSPPPPLRSAPLSPVAGPSKTGLRNISSPPSSPAKKKKGVVENKPMEDVILQPGSFEVLLLVDNAEIFGNTKAKESTTRAELTSLNVKFHVRSLKVGDFAWIAQDTTNGHELVLPYIVERKRVDDLACSIKDGRYHEQKFRLNQCGIQNRIYLIESMGKGDMHVGLPITTLRQASINTQIHGGFSVKHTSSHWNSMQYLATLTKVITRLYKDKILLRCRKEDLSKCHINDDLVSLMDFEEFNKGASKIRKWRVREMFIKHLVQLRGLSVEKAVAIVQRYPTPRALLAAYASVDGATLLAKIPFGKAGKTIGPVISAAVHKLYTSGNLT